MTKTPGIMERVIGFEPTTSSLGMWVQPKIAQSFREMIREKR